MSGCLKCGNESATFMASLIIQAPMQFWHRLSKKAVSKKEVIFHGVDWHRSTIYCNECGAIDMSGINLREVKALNYWLDNGYTARKEDGAIWLSNGEFGFSMPDAIKQMEMQGKEVPF